jgi:hypothetical protein
LPAVVLLESILVFVAGSFGSIAGGALAVQYASVERFVPMQARGLAILLAALGVLVLTWHS